MEKNLLRLSDSHSDPVADMRLAAQEIARATRRVIGRAVDSSPIGDVARALLKPRLRVVELSEAVVVTLEVPGLDSDSVDVTLSSKDVLCVRGLRGDGQEEPSIRDSGILLSRSGFERTVPLGGRKLRRDRASAVLANGVLTITLPKERTEEQAPTASRDVHAA